MEYRFDEDRRSARRVCLQAGGGRVVAVLSPNPQANDGQAALRTPSLVRSSIPLDPRLRCKSPSEDQPNACAPTDRRRSRSCRPRRSHGRRPDEPSVQRDLGRIAGFWTQAGKSQGGRA